MNKQIYELLLLICILILTCITLYFYLVKPYPLSYYGLESFKEGMDDPMGNGCDKGSCGTFLNKLCHYKNADTESGTLGPRSTDYYFKKKIMPKDKQGAGLKTKYQDFTLCDYYIMTAFNCCSTGKFNGDEANLCALQNSIRYGARCLDFAIYSASSLLPNAFEPIISYSNKMIKSKKGTLLDNHYAKSSRNEKDLTLNSALSVVKSMGFSGRSDPLILHFRIKTSAEETMNQMYDLLVKYFGSNIVFQSGMLLNKKFGFCGEGKDFDISTVSIKELMGKVIILVDNHGNKFKRTNLYKITNSSTGTFREAESYQSKFQNTTISDLKSKGTSIPGSSESINRVEHYNKTHLTFVMPDKTSPTNNIHDSSENNLMFSIERGCQMIGMSFQQFDPSLQYYLTEFFGAYSFKLKPSNLRQTPILMDMPKKQDKSKVDPAPKQVNIGDGTDIVLPITV